MQLEPHATPISNTGRGEFFNSLDDDGFYLGDYPEDWFDVTPIGVRLKSRVAVQLRWNIEEVVNGYVNMNAPAQRATIDGETYDIHPGFWCSTIPEKDLATEQ
jgi:hypothetical protein